MHFIRELFKLETLHIVYRKLEAGSYHSESDLSYKPLEEEELESSSDSEDDNNEDQENYVMEKVKVTAIKAKRGEEAMDEGEGADDKMDVVAMVKIEDVEIQAEAEEDLNGNANEGPTQAEPLGSAFK